MDDLTVQDLKKLVDFIFYVLDLMTVANIATKLLKNTEKIIDIRIFQMDQACTSGLFSIKETAAFLSRLDRSLMI